MLACLLLIEVFLRTCVYVYVAIRIVYEKHLKIESWLHQKYFCCYENVDQEMLRIIPQLHYVVLTVVVFDVHEFVAF